MQLATAPRAEPAHHPAAETLTAYAAGVLAAGFEIVVAAHLRGCTLCRRELALLQCVGGALLEDATAHALADEALEGVLTQCDAPAPPHPQSLDDILRDAQRRWVAPGIWVAPTSTPLARGDRLYLLGAAPGVATAKHTHHGAEFTQILRGALADGGAVYRAGDFAETDGETMHRPKAIGDEECVCLFATEGRLIPVSWLGRIAFAIADV